MSTSFVAYATGGSTNTTPACNKPTDTADGHVMLAVVVCSSDTLPTIAPPAGWALVATDANGADRRSLYYKIAASEGASYTFTLSNTSGAIWAEVGIVTYADVRVCDSPVHVSSNTAYTTSNTTFRAASVDPTVQPTMLVIIGGWWQNHTATAPEGFTERMDVYDATGMVVYAAEKYYESLEPTGVVDATLSGAATRKHAFLVALDGDLSSPYPPTITAPAASEKNRSGTSVAFTCSAVDPNSDPVAYIWEIDTTNPPDSASANYETIQSGYVASAASASVYKVFTTATRGAWYCRARATDGTYTSDWSAVVTFYNMDAIRLLPDTQVEISQLECANKVFVVVDGTPATTANATNTTIAPTYATSPREMLVLIKAGDATACAAVAASTLALRQSPRYRLTGLKVPLRYGLGIQRGQKVRINVPRASIVDGDYAVRRVEHDFGSNITTIDVGEYVAPRDEQEALVRLAEITAQLQKEAGI